MSKQRKRTHSKRKILQAVRALSKGEKQDMFEGVDDRTPLEKSRMKARVGKGFDLDKFQREWMLYEGGDIGHDVGDAATVEEACGAILARTCEELNAALIDAGASKRGARRVIQGACLTLGNLTEEKGW
jgi:hypothetical protein